MNDAVLPADVYRRRRRRRTGAERAMAGFPSKGHSRAGVAHTIASALVWRRASSDLGARQAGRRSRRVERHTEPLLLPAAFRSRPNRQRLPPVQRFGRDRPLVAGALGAGALAFLALTGMTTTPARAETCGIAPVVAAGEPSRILTLAKIKARANWRAKVRALARYGGAYSNWSRAERTEETCTLHDGRYRCRAKAIPCKY
jgi:hypothetical protein